MFVRTADFKIEAWYDQSNLFDLQKDWPKVIRSEHICKDNTCPFITKASFDYEPDNFLYYRARAITADIPNGNGDMFPFPEIDSSWKTFVCRGVYLNHDNDDPEKAFGIILDAVFHTQFKPAYVEILGAIDKELTEDKHPGLVRQISNGIINSTSMSCMCQEAECAICHNRAKNETELCAHMNPGSKERPNPNYVKGRKCNGSLAFEINYGVMFTEDSIVNIPADQTAHIFEVYARLNKASTIDEIKRCLAELNALLTNLEN